MQSVMETMLSKLQTKIARTEEELGEKYELARIDLDGDGEISAEELRTAIVQLLNRKTSLEEAEELIAVFDTDKDGKG